MPEEEPQEYHKAVTTVSGVLADTTKGAGKNVRATTLLSTGANKGFLKTLVTGVAAAVTAAKVHLQDTVSHVKEAFTTVSVASSAMRAFVKVVTTAVDGVSNIVKRTSKAATAVRRSDGRQGELRPQGESCSRKGSKAVARPLKRAWRLNPGWSSRLRHCVMRRYHGRSGKRR